ncbi:MAG: glucose/arabinose dehydrogenase [Bacteroidia bacterium]|jgi:glucose/arabinose dehydrogenase
MKKALITAITLCITIGAFAQGSHTLDSTTLTSRVVKDSLDIPWEILWGPDDHIWMTERYGRVSRINPETGQQFVLLDLSADVYQNSESGMLGMALHPDFENNPHVFVAYTYLAGSNIRERLVRFNYDGTKLVAADTLVDDINGNTTHIGCRLFILPDNTMLMSTGDAQNQQLPQNRTSLSGKILRMNLDGTVPSDNPDPNSLVWSSGHRNAQGIWQAPNGIIYSSEHGPTTDDELNILTPNRNYGWPTVAGFCDSPPENVFCSDSNVVEPLVAWTPTIAPSDIIWYDNWAIPEFRNKLLMTVLKDKSLIVFEFNEAGDSVISEKKYFKNEFQRLRDICVSPNGKIYLATSGSSWRNTSPFTHTIVELSNEDHNASLGGPLQYVKVRIGPNPLGIGQSLKLILPNSTKGTFELFDLLGRPVHHQDVNKSTVIRHSPNTGIYVWRVTLEDGGVKEGKLVVE